MLHVRRTPPPTTAIPHTPPQAILVLVNAVYFKGLWHHQFRKPSTTGQRFHPLAAGAAPYQAPTMLQVYPPARDPAHHTAVKVRPAGVCCAVVCLLLMKLSQ